MNQREAFNLLFDNGYNYSTYRSQSDRHQARMQQSFDAAATYLEDSDEEELAFANHPLRVLVIAENWCGDCANGVPVIAKLAEKMDKWDFKITPRDEYKNVVSQYYTTAGRKKIPVIIFADEDGDEIARWVERPARSYELLAELQALKLPKEEYIERYKSSPELRPPEVSYNILDELLFLASKAATMNKILPAKE